ncbi:MAG TPA: signal peptidase II, partial [Gammaproteobacteria bacterium]|nr:signal peptidase II [Gammaproteobacteria bacterium]
MHNGEPESSVQEEEDRGSPLLIWLRLSALVLFLDQATKILAEYSLELYQRVELLPFMNLTLMQNHG